MVSSSQLAHTRCPRQHRRAPAQGESELDASIAARVRVVATDSLRQLRSYATPYFLADTPLGWRPWLHWEILWWGSTRDANPPRTLPCFARQASQAPRSPSPAKRSDGRVIWRGCEAVAPHLTMVLAHAEAPSILPRAQRCQPHTRRATLPLDSTTWPVQEETMRQTMILTGEINLKTVTDPTVPFRRVTKELGEADLIFADLECLLADPPAHIRHQPGGFPYDQRRLLRQSSLRRGPEARWLRWRGMCQQRHVRRGRHSGVAGPAEGTRYPGYWRRPEPG